LITPIFGEEYKLCSSSLCSFLWPPVTSSLTGQNILLSTLFQTPSIWVLPLMWETKFHTHTYKGKNITKMAVFWVVALCSLVEVYQRFRGPCCIHHQGDE
jgi:hypothetical protein